MSGEESSGHRTVVSTRPPPPSRVGRKDSLLPSTVTSSETEIGVKGFLGKRASHFLNVFSSLTPWIPFLHLRSLDHRKCPGRGTHQKWPTHSGQQRVLSARGNADVSHLSLLCNRNYKSWFNKSNKSVIETEGGSKGGGGKSSSCWWG